MGQQLKKFLAAMLWSLIIQTASAQSVVYTPISPGYDFPATSEKLLGALKTGDSHTLRLHAWTVFAGLTQPARPADVTSEAVWETWFSGEEVFGIAPLAANEPAAPANAERAIQRRFTTPRQFLPLGGMAAPLAVGQSNTSFTLFNKELRDHTRTNNLHRRSTLEAINSAWPASAPVESRRIKDYPTQAMSLKLIWKRVNKTGLTQLPVWDEKPRMPVAPEQPEKSWERVVLIDPTRLKIPANERKDALVNGKLLKDAVVVPLSSFYRFQLGAQQAASLGAAEGDWMVLVAMHYTTKEIPNWVWATFWWHDKPEVGQYAADKPGTAVLKDVWRNYLMDVSYDMDSPKESDGTPNAVFNPYLEAGFANGVNSNCMTCHQRAVWTKKGAEFLPITRGAAKPTDAHFKDATMVDFLWSLLLEGGS